MKKLLSIGLLTVCALALTARQADAWVNAKFSVGLNWHLQSANNNTLWGVWKNGQVPGPEAFGQPAGIPPGQMGPLPGPGPYMPPAGTFPYFGNNPQGGPQGFPQGIPGGFPADITQQPNVAFQGQNMYYPPQNYGYNPYQTVSYQPTNGYYYPTYMQPNYYQPNYYQNYAYQTPYYWNQGR